jgi:ERCC4-type nuclease
MLLDIPGINYRNCHHVMSHVKNIRELSEMSLAQCEALIGENGKLVYRFFNDPQVMNPIQMND